MPKRCILVPLDLSDVTETVLLEARRLARACRAEIHLLHVGYDSQRTGGMEFELADRLTWVRMQHAMQRARLSQYAQVLGHEGFRIRTRFAEGNARKEILAQARDLDPAAIMIGMHGHGVMHDVLRGSIRRSLLREGAWPVVMVSAGRKEVAQSAN